MDAALFDRLPPATRMDPERLFASPDVEVVRDKRNLTARMLIDGRPVWLKRFRPAHVRDRVVYAMKAGKSVYAWNAAMALMENEFCTPRPILGLRRAGRTGGGEGVIGFEDVGDHAPLGELLAAGPPGAVERDRAMHELGECLRRFHDLGFRHRDLRQGNILVVEKNGTRNFCFLDLNRLRIQKPLTELQRLREVEKLNLPVSGLETFFGAYMPERDSGGMASTYRSRVAYADRLEHLTLGRLVRKAWYYYWELRAFAPARRP